MKKKWSKEYLERALEQCERAVMGVANVTGVALGEENGEPRLIVYVDHGSQAISTAIEESYGGVKVRIEETGPFSAF